MKLHTAMDKNRKLVLWLSVGATIFVLAAAFLTGNSGLYLLAGLSAASSIYAWQRKNGG
jgi:hypothetical protein